MIHNKMTYINSVNQLIIEYLYQTRQKILDNSLYILYSVICKLILEFKVVSIRSTADIAITLIYLDSEMSKGDDFKFSLPRRVTAGD